MIKHMIEILFFTHTPCKPVYIHNSVFLLGVLPIIFGGKDEIIILGIILEPDRRYISIMERRSFLLLHLPGSKRV